MVKRVLVGGVSAKLTQVSCGGGGECPDHTASPAEEPKRRTGTHAGSLLERKQLPGFYNNSPYTYYKCFLLNSNFEEMLTISKVNLFCQLKIIPHLNLLNC